MKILLLYSSSAGCLIGCACFFWTMYGPLEGEERDTGRWVTVCAFLVAILLRVSALTVP